MTLRLGLIHIFWGDQGGFRPSIWLRLPDRWGVLFLDRGKRWMWVPR